MTIKTTLLLPLLAFTTLSLGGCGESPSEPPEPETSKSPDPPCEIDADCEDNSVCTGVDLCAPESSRADERGCIAKSVVECDPGEVCSARTGTCSLVGCDEDGDGHDSVDCGGDDCDDDDFNRYPGNVEFCISLDGKPDKELAEHDEDCEPKTLGTDRDEDGYYDSRCANPQGDGELLFGLDCDDENDLRRPGFAEICDGLDNDCQNGLDFPGEDDDGDGYADCEDLTGTGLLDCDDTNAEVNPGISTDECDGIDSDCDGSPEDADRDGQIDPASTCEGGALPKNDCNDDDEYFSCPAVVLHGSPDCSKSCNLGCDEGFADCDGEPESGCETNLGLNTNHCGACGNVCPYGCNQGACIEPLKIATGHSNTCALLDTGAVWCWGQNTSGELGNGTTGLHERTPQLVVGIDGIRNRAIDVSPSCAVLEHGEIRCWGSDQQGQRGDGGGAEADSGLPVQVSGIDGVSKKAIAVASTSASSCAILQGGAITCWGSRKYGQVGDGSSSETPRYLPVNVTGIDGTSAKATQVVVGWNHACAVLSTGAVRCWGRDLEGQLGDGIDDAANEASPVPVNGIDGVSAKAIQISADGNSTCAVLDDGVASCWGSDTREVLGNDDLVAENRPTPTPVSGIDGINKIAAEIRMGIYHACVRLESGAVECWGQNVFGQLGNGLTSSDIVPTPSPVLDLDGSSSDNFAVSLAVSTVPQSCVITEEGSMKCWGRAGGGALGDGGTDLENKARPTEVLRADRSIVDLATASAHACALDSNGAVFCWGSDTLGQLGNGDEPETYQAYPVAVTGLDGVAAKAIAIDANGAQSCALLDTGAMKCWGNDNFGQLGDGDDGQGVESTPVSVLGLDGSKEKVVGLMGGNSFACALLHTGEVRCWGRDAHGELGDGNDDNGNEFSPATVSSLDGLTSIAVAIAGGQEHACAILSTGAVMCWGKNDVGQLGNAQRFTNAHVPSSVVTLDGLTSSASAIACGRDHSCALDSGGQVYCWGSDTNGQLGDGDDGQGDEDEPVLISEIDDAVAVGAGYLSSFAIQADGSALAWGGDNFGSAGDGPADQSRKYLPVSVNYFGLNMPAVKIDAGADFVCGLDARGMVSCWGMSSSGQQGDGSITGFDYSPTSVIWR